MLRLERTTESKSRCLHV